MQNWYALHTRPSCEPNVQNSLLKKEYDAYVPMIKNTAGSRGSKRQMYAPLFPSLVLVRTDEKAMNDLLHIPAVLGFYHWHNKPAVIQAAEVARLRKFLSRYTTVEKQKIQVAEASSLTGPSDDSASEFIWTIISDGCAKLPLPSLGYCLTAPAEEAEGQWADRPGKQGLRAFGKRARG